MEPSKPKKRKLNVKKLLIFILIIYLLGYGAYYLSKKPIKNIIINGNYLVSDAEIIRTAGIANYPSIIGVKTKNLEKKLLNLDLVEKVKIKKDFKFRLIITITESKPLFLYNVSNKLMLTNGEFIENDFNYIGIPNLINFAPENILKELALKLKNIDYGILSLISEFEYSQLSSETGTLIDDTRFILYMNDGNQVHINISRCKDLNRYREIYAGLKDVKGTIYLDNRQNAYFEPYKDKNEL